MSRYSVSEEKKKFSREFQFLVFKSSRPTYSMIEKQEIVDHLVSGAFYSLVSGNTVWRRMEKAGLCKGNRTYKSMKQQFTEDILPDIESYGLTRLQVDSFRAGMDLTTETENLGHRHGVDKELVNSEGSRTGNGDNVATWSRHRRIHGSTLEAGPANNGDSSNNCATSSQVSTGLQEDRGRAVEEDVETVSPQNETVTANANLDQVASGDTGDVCVSVVEQRLQLPSTADESEMEELLDKTGQFPSFLQEESGMEEGGKETSLSDVRGNSREGPDGSLDMFDHSYAESNNFETITKFEDGLMGYSNEANLTYLDTITKIKDDLSTEAMSDIDVNRPATDTNPELEQLLDDTYQLPSFLQSPSGTRGESPGASCDVLAYSSNNNDLDTREDALGCDLENQNEMGASTDSTIFESINVHVKEGEADRNNSEKNLPQYQDVRKTRILKRQYNSESSSGSGEKNASKQLQRECFSSVSEVIVRGLGASADRGEILVVVEGLPDNVDSEDIELIRADYRHQEEEAEVVGGGKKSKLKIVAIDNAPKRKALEH